MRNVTNNALSRLSTPQLCRQPAPPSSFNSAALGIILGERCVWRVGTGRGRLPALFTCPTVQVVSAAQLIYGYLPTSTPLLAKLIVVVVARILFAEVTERSKDSLKFVCRCSTRVRTRTLAPHGRRLNRCTHCLSLSSGTDDVNVTRHTT